jgi:tellurite resistance protein TerB
LFGASARCDWSTSGLYLNSPDKTGLLHWRIQRIEKTGAVMTKRYTRSSATMAEHMADRLDNRDEDVMQGLVTAGALVALADGRVEEVERDELLNFIDRQQLAPTIPRTDIAEVFDRRVQQLEDRDSAEVIIENLRPLIGLSLASVVLRTAQRVAAADRQIHSGELQALELIRLIMTSLSAKGLPVRLRTCDRAAGNFDTSTRARYGVLLRT